MIDDNKVRDMNVSVNDQRTRKYKFFSIVLVFVLLVIIIMVLESYKYSVYVVVLYFVGLLLFVRSAIVNDAFTYMKFDDENLTIVRMRKKKCYSWNDVVLCKLTEDRFNTKIYKLILKDSESGEEKSFNITNNLLVDYCFKRFYLIKSENFPDKSRVTLTDSKASIKYMYNIIMRLLLEFTIIIIMYYQITGSVFRLFSPIMIVYWATLAALASYVINVHIANSKIKYKIEEEGIFDTINKKYFVKWENMYSGSIIWDSSVNGKSQFVKLHYSDSEEPLIKTFVVENTSRIAKIMSRYFEIENVPVDEELIV